MSDKESNKTGSATPDDILREQIVNPSVSKNEREWWASKEIQSLQFKLELLRKHYHALLGWDKDKIVPILQSQLEQMTIERDSWEKSCGMEIERCDDYHNEIIEKVGAIKKAEQKLAMAREVLQFYADAGHTQAIAALKEL